MKKLLIMSAAALAFAAPQAFAEEGKGPAGEGKPHRGEKMFQEADANADGLISKDEFKAHHEKKMEEWFAKLDANGDGNITKEEAKAGREKMKEHMKEKMKDAEGEEKSEPAPPPPPAE